jgi:hypothetical protein
MHHEAVPGNLDIGEEMAGPFPALDAMAHFDRTVGASDFESHGAAETGTFQHCLPLSAVNLPGTLQFGLSEQALTSHHVQNEYAFLFVSVKDSTRRFNDLTVARLFQLGGHRTQQRLALEFVNMCENTPDKLSGSSRIFDRDVVRNGFEIR